MAIKCAVTIVGREAYPSYNFLDVPRPGDRVVLPIDGEPEHFTVVSVLHWAADAHQADAPLPSIKITVAKE
jgi:hypothetical protein